MELQISDRRGVPVAENMIGLFFEDINYAADGGLYAELIENRAFEFQECCGRNGDFYTRQDSGYGWTATRQHGEGRMEYVSGSPVHRNNPHYLRFTASCAGQGFANKAYRGLFLKKGQDYHVSFYARAAAYGGDFEVRVEKDGKCYGARTVSCVHAPGDSWQKWQKYETVLTPEEDTEGALFILSLTQPGTAEFDFISMMPADAVAGVFRRDLFNLLKDLKPGFLRFPGGCVVEGCTLENRYRWKDSVGPIEERRPNFNRWATSDASEENGWCSVWSHYNQTLGLGYYEYFLLCELIGAKPLPVLSVGLACQFQSYELVEPADPAFSEFVQDALDLIEFANGGEDTRWGSLRVRMGHPAPFGLDMLGIGNEQWETPQTKFFERYSAFERAIHERYPRIRLIGSAGPDVTSEHHRAAWNFYYGRGRENQRFCYAVDEHYYMKPEWFYGHTDFYDDYSRDVKVFSGEYAAHPAYGEGDKTAANTLGGALAEAAFLTGVERNADLVVMASYAPLFARVGYAQWTPDLIWFDERHAYGTPSYYVQKMYSENLGTVTVPMQGQEKALAREGVYLGLSLDRKSGELIVKAVNHGPEEKEIRLILPEGWRLDAQASWQVLAGGEEDRNTLKDPEHVSVKKTRRPFEGSLKLAPMSFSVVRISGTVF